MSGAGAAPEGAGGARGAPRAQLVFLPACPGGYPVASTPSIVDIKHNPRGTAFAYNSQKWLVVALMVDGKISLDGPEKVRMCIIDERDPEVDARSIDAKVSGRAKYTDGRKKACNGLFYFSSIDWLQAGKYRVWFTLHNSTEFIFADEDYESLEWLVHVRDEAYERQEFETLLASLQSALEEQQSKRVGEAGYALQPLTKKEQAWLQPYRGAIGTEPAPQDLLKLSIDMQKAFGTLGRKDTEVLSAFFESNERKQLRLKLEADKRKVLAEKGALLLRSRTDAASDSTASAASLLKNEVTARLMAQYSMDSSAVTQALAKHAQEGATGGAAGAGASAGRTVASAALSHRHPSQCFQRSPEALRRVPRKRAHPMHLAGPGPPFSLAVDIAQRWMRAREEEVEDVLKAAERTKELSARAMAGDRVSMHHARTVLKGPRSHEIAHVRSLRVHPHEPIPAGTGLCLASNMELHILYRLRMLRAAVAAARVAARRVAESYAKEKEDYDTRKAKLEKRGAAGSAQAMLREAPNLESADYFARKLSIAFHSVSRLDPGCEDVQLLRFYLDPDMPRGERGLYDEEDALDNLNKRRKTDAPAAAPPAPPAPSSASGAGGAGAGAGGGGGWSLPSVSSFVSSVLQGVVGAGSTASGTTVNAGAQSTASGGSRKRREMYIPADTVWPQQWKDHPHIKPLPAQSWAYRTRCIPDWLARVSRTVVVQGDQSDLPSSMRDTHARPSTGSVSGVSGTGHSLAASTSSMSAHTAQWPGAYGSLHYKRVPWREEDKLRGSRYECVTLLYDWARRHPGTMPPDVRAALEGHGSHALAHPSGLPFPSLMSSLPLGPPSQGSLPHGFDLTAWQEAQAADATRRMNAEWIRKGCYAQLGLAYRPAVFRDSASASGHGAAEAGTGTGGSTASTQGTEGAASASTAASTLQNSAAALSLPPVLSHYIHSHAWSPPWPLDTHAAVGVESQASSAATLAAKADGRPRGQGKQKAAFAAATEAPVTITDTFHPLLDQLQQNLPTPPTWNPAVAAEHAEAMAQFTGSRSSSSSSSSAAASAGSAAGLSSTGTWNPPAAVLLSIPTTSEPLQWGHRPHLAPTVWCRPVHDYPRLGSTLLDEATDAIFRQEPALEGVPVPPMQARAPGSAMMAAGAEQGGAGSTRSAPRPDRPAAGGKATKKRARDR